MMRSVALLPRARHPTGWPDVTIRCALSFALRSHRVKTERYNTQRHSPPHLSATATGLRTRPLAAKTTLSTPSSPRPPRASTSRAPSTLTSSLQSSTRYVCVTCEPRGLLRFFVPPCFHRLLSLPRPPPMIVCSRDTRSIPPASLFIRLPLYPPPLPRVVHRSAWAPTAASTTRTS